MKSFFTLRRSNEGKSAPAKLVKEPQKAKPAPVSVPSKQPDVTLADPQAKSAKPKQRNLVSLDTPSKPIPTEENVVVSSTRKHRSSSRPPIPVMFPPPPPPSQAQPPTQKTLDPPYPPTLYTIRPPPPTSVKPPVQPDVPQHLPTYPLSQTQVPHPQSTASRQLEPTTYDHPREASKSKPKESSRRERDQSRHRDVSDRDREKESRRKAERDKEREREQRRRERELAKTQEKEDRVRQAVRVEREARERVQKLSDREAEDKLREDKRRLQEEDRRKLQEEEKRRAQDLEDIRRAQELEARRRTQEEETRRAQEKEEKRRAQEDEKREQERRLFYEQERRRVYEQEMERRQTYELEQRRRNQEAEQERRQEERRLNLEEQRRRAQELEEKHRAQEEERRLALEEQHKREIEDKRRAQEQEDRRLALEEQRRRAQELEEQRKRAQDLEDKRRVQEQEEQRKRAQEMEERRRAQEQEERRQEQERRRAQELEEKRQEQERRRAQELEEKRLAQEMEQRRRELEEKRRAQAQEQERRRAYELEQRRRAQELDDKREQERRKAQEQEEARRAYEKEQKRRLLEQEEARRALEKEAKRREQEEIFKRRQQEILEREEREQREKVARRERERERRDKDKAREKAKELGRESRRERDIRKDAEREDRQRTKEYDLSTQEDPRLNTSSQFRDLSSQALYNSSQGLTRPPLAVLRTEEGDSSDSSRRHRTNGASAHRRFYTDEGPPPVRYPEILQPSSQLVDHKAYDYTNGKLANSTSHTRSASLPQDVPIASTRPVVLSADPQRYKASHYPVDPIPYDLAQKSTQSSINRSDNRPVFQTVAGSKFVESSHVPSNDLQGAPKRTEHAITSATLIPAAGFIGAEQRISQIVSIRAGQGPPDPLASNVFPKLGPQQTTPADVPTPPLKHNYSDSLGPMESRPTGATAVPNTNTGPIARSTPDRPPPSVPVPMSGNPNRVDNLLPGSADSGYASGSKPTLPRSSPNKGAVNLSTPTDLNAKASPSQRVESSPSRARLEVPHSTRPSPIQQKKEITPSPRTTTQAQLESVAPNLSSARPSPASFKPDSQAVVTIQGTATTSYSQREQEIRSKSARPSPTIPRREVSQPTYSPAQDRKDGAQSSRPSPQELKRDISHSPAVNTIDQKQEEVPKAHYSTRTAVAQKLKGQGSYDDALIRDPPKTVTHVSKDEGVHAATPHSARPSPDNRLRELSNNLSTEPSRNLDSRRQHKPSQPSPVAPLATVSTQSRPQAMDTRVNTNDQHKFSDSENFKSGVADISKSSTAMATDASWGWAQAEKLASLLSHTHTPKSNVPVSSATAYAVKYTSQAPKNSNDRPLPPHINSEKRKDNGQYSFWEPSKPSMGTSRSNAPQAPEVAHADPIDQRGRPSVYIPTDHTAVSSADDRQRSAHPTQKPSFDRDISHHTHPAIRNASQPYNESLPVPPQILHSISQNSITTSTRPNPPSPDPLYHLASHSDFPALPPHISSTYTTSYIPASMTVPVNDKPHAPHRDYAEIQEDGLRKASTRNEPLLELPTRKEAPVVPAISTVAPVAPSRQTPTQSTQPSGTVEGLRPGASEAARYAAEYIQSAAQRPTPESTPVAQPPVIAPPSRPEIRHSASLDTLKTPPSIAHSILKPTISHTSVAPSTDSQRKKTGFLGLFKKPREVTITQKDLERLAPPQVVEEKLAPQTLRTRGPGADRVKPSAYTPFTHLMPKRHFTPSSASVDAQDGTAAGNTTIGSPTVSMHSNFNILPPPPQSNPVRDTKQWVSQEATTSRERRGRDGKTRPHKPGVVFNVREDFEDDAKPRPKPVRRATGRGKDKKRDRDRSQRDREKT